jgi:hypothetical protein
VRPSFKLMGRWDSGPSPFFSFGKDATKDKTKMQSITYLSD